MNKAKRMNIKMARSILISHQVRPRFPMTLEKTNSLERAFDVFLSSNPTKKDFKKHLQYVILTAGMLYSLFKRKA